MACGCGKRARAKAAGKEIAGYRVTLPDETIVPPLNKPPLMSPAEARAIIRENGGGTAHVEYRDL